MPPWRGRVAGLGRRLIGLRAALLPAVCLAAVALAGCKRDIAAEDEAAGPRPMIETPGAVPPTVNFPAELETEDPTVNAFVRNTLRVCADGDYEQFRKLFAAQHRPADQADFERIWRNVAEVTVKGLFADARQPPQGYAVHAFVRLREPDTHERLTHDVVLLLVKEEGEWRLKPASREVTRRVLTAESQPATEPADQPVATEPEAGQVPAGGGSATQGASGV